MGAGSLSAVRTTAAKVPPDRRLGRHSIPITAAAISLTGVTKCRIPHYQRVGSRALEVKGASGSTSRKDYRGRGARVGQPFPKQRGGDRDLSLQAFGTTRLLGRCCSSPVCRTPYRQSGGDHRQCVVRTGLRPGRRRVPAQGRRRLREGEWQQDRVEHYPVRAGTAEEDRKSTR